MTAVAVAAGTQEVEDRGEGRPLLWLGSSFGEASWLPVHELLAGTCRVLAPHAPSLRPGGVLERIDTMEDYAVHLVDVLDALELPRVAVAGASFGGWVAAEIASRWPERIEALVLIDAMGLRLAGEPVPELFALNVAQLAKLVLHEPRAVDVAAIPTFDRAADPMETVGRMIEGQEAMARMGWSPYLHDPKLPERLRRYRGPALVVWGEDDRVVGEGHAHAWASLLRARMVVVDGAGHLPAIERPDVVARIVADALSR